MKPTRSVVALLLVLCTLVLAACRVYEDEDDQDHYERGGFPKGAYYEWDTDGGHGGTGP